MKRSKRRGEAGRGSGFGRLSRLAAENKQAHPGEVLEALNSIPVTDEDLWCIGEDLGSRFGVRGFEEGFSSSDVLAVVRKRFGNNEPEKGSAIFFRFEALTSFLASESNLQWDDALVAAATVEPIVKIGDELTFQRESFLRACLSSTRLEALHHGSKPFVAAAVATGRSGDRDCSRRMRSQISQR